MGISKVLPLLKLFGAQCKQVAVVIYVVPVHLVYCSDTISFHQHLF